MFDDLRRERQIRRVMRDLSAQRVVMVLQPGNIPVIEKAIATTDEDVIAALHTALLRGWVEVLHDAVPRAQIPADGSLPKRWEHTAPIYRVTDAGWNAIHRTQGWVIPTFVGSLAALVGALVALVLDLSRTN